MDGRKAHDKTFAEETELTFSAVLTETEKLRVYENQSQSV